MKKVDDDTWVFLSHSNKDYEKVRRVRDLLENQGRRPLMFFLKCLEDNHEVWELIKREIDARPRFMLCKSGHTEDPQGWVQKEFNYIKDQQKPFEIVDLDSDDLITAINRLVKRSNVYVCSDCFYYKPTNEVSSFTDILKGYLRKKSFIVNDYEDLYNGSYLLPGVCTMEDNLILHRNTVKSYLDIGYVILLWSKSLNNSARKEVVRLLSEIHNSKYVLSFIIDKGIDVDSLEFLYDMHKTNNLIIKDLTNETNVDSQCKLILKNIKELDIKKNNH